MDIGPGRFTLPESVEGRPTPAYPVILPGNAAVAQLVEHQLPKLRVASSSLVRRSGARRGRAPEGAYQSWQQPQCGQQTEVPTSESKAAPQAHV